MTSEDLLVKSKYFPRNLKGIYPKKPEYFAVDPKSFDVVDSVEVYFTPMACNGIEYIATQTELDKREYSVIFFGYKQGTRFYFDSYSALKSEKNASVYSPKQRENTTLHLTLKDTEVLYGHSHVANGVSYNKFSITDLNYYVRKALETKRNVYAILITRDTCIVVVYDYGKQEFFKVPINVPM